MQGNSTHFKATECSTPGDGVSSQALNGELKELSTNNLQILLQIFTNSYSHFIYFHIFVF